jgi:hypothetical protein
MRFSILVLSFSISYWDLIKFHYFTDTSKRGVRGVKGGPKTGWRQADFADFSIGHTSSGSNLCQKKFGWCGMLHKCEFLKIKLNIPYFLGGKNHQISNIKIEFFSQHVWLVS